MGMEIINDGCFRTFASGAVRDVDDNKGRCDLLPLDVIGDISDNPIFTLVNGYIRTGDKRLIVEAIRGFSDTRYGDFHTAILEVSKHYSDGAKKYTERNWEKGINLHCYIDSGIRHYLKYLRGDTDEPHDRAFLWNMMGALWTHDHHPEFCDLPFCKEEER
jgi:hypothetical protein